MNWDRHRTWTWRKPQGYLFAQELRSIPVTVAEAAAAAACFPLVFVAGPMGPTLHILLRCAAQGVSAFIGQQGQWQAAWLPPRLQVWPFDLLAVGERHAFCVDETSALVIKGPGGVGLFAQEGTQTLSQQTAQMAAILKEHAEALPATHLAATALRARGLLCASDADASILTIDPIAAANITEADVIYLHRAGALALFHAGLVSLAHWQWMLKAEKRLATDPMTQVNPPPVRKRVAAGAGFLAALATQANADEASIWFSGLSQP